MHLTELGRRLVWAEHADDKLEDLPEFIVRSLLGSLAQALANLLSPLQMTQQIHQDMVHKCPADFELLAWSDLTPVQGIVHLYPKDKVIPFTHSHPRISAEDPWKHVHIIAFQASVLSIAPLRRLLIAPPSQGHPECRSLAGVFLECC